MATVTVIDDEAGLVELLELILTSRGYRVHGFTDPEKGLAHLVHTPGDLVLLDLMMPGLTGWELLHRLEESPETAGLPVIMISAFLDHQPAIHTWIKAGALAHLSKPFDIDRLIQQLEALLGEAQEPSFRRRLSQRRGAVIRVS